jgi:amino acid transporter
MVAIPIFFVDMDMVTDMCSAGTLFAFCLVCAGVLKLRMDPHAPPSKFKTPYISGRILVPALFLVFIAYLGMDEETHCFSVTSLNDLLVNFPTYAFLLGFAIFSVLAFKYRFSLIPSLGFLCCFYMLSQLGHMNWLYFGAWLLVGLLIYFVYGRSHSNLAGTKRISENSTF